MRTLRSVSYAACAAGLFVAASPAAAETAQEAQTAAAERTVHALELVRDNPLRCTIS
jgi:hypothetical protein